MATDGKQSFFTTLPGLLTSIAAFLAALTTVYVTYRQHAVPSVPASSLTNAAGPPELSSNQQPIAGGSLTNPEQRRSAIETIVPPNQQSVILQQRQAVQQLSSRYLAADQSNDIETEVALSATPFYFQNEVLVTLSSLRQHFLSSGEDEHYAITSMRADTIGELKQSGVDVGRGGVEKSISLDDSAWIVQFTVRNNQGANFLLLIYVRYIEGLPKVVGFQVAKLRDT